MKKAHSLLILAATLGLSATANSAIVTNAVDNGTGWTNIGGGFYSATAGGLAPQAGTQFWTATSPDLRGVFQEFNVNYQFGTTYTAEFYVGDLNTQVFAGGQAYFLVDADGDGYTFSDRIEASRVVTNPTPSDGSWQKWTLTTTITDGIQTAGGHAVLETDKLAFAYFFDGASSVGAAFDNFSVTAVPEPATFAFLAGLATLGLVLYRRRSH